MTIVLPVIRKSATHEQNMISDFGHLLLLINRNLKHSKNNLSNIFYTFSLTMNSSSLSSEKKRTQCEIYTRVMGYYRPVSQFNRGKKSEFYTRKYFNEKRTLS